MDESLGIDVTGFLVPDFLLQQSMLRDFSAIESLLNLNLDGTLCQTDEDACPNHMNSTVSSSDESTASGTASRGKTGSEGERLRRRVKRQQRRNLRLQQQLQESKAEAQARNDELQKKNEDAKRVVWKVGAACDRITEAIENLLKGFGRPVLIDKPEEVQKLSLPNDDLNHQRQTVEKLESTVKFMEECQLEKCLVGKNPNGEHEEIRSSVEESVPVLINSSGSNGQPDSSSIQTTIRLCSPKDHEFDVSEKPNHGRDVDKLGFVCMCKLSFSSKKGLDTHVRYKEDDRRFECDVCGGRFVFLSGLRKHRRRVHGVEEVAATFGCSLCGSSFASVADVNRHRRTVHKGNKGSSGVKKTSKIPAQKTTSTKSKVTPTPAAAAHDQRNSLNNEGTAAAIHAVDGSVPGGCTCVCGQVYKKWQYLRNHIHYYTAPREFKCGLCTMDFVYASLLAQHLKTVHKVQKSFAICQWCRLSFKSIQGLWLHSRKTHGISVVSIGMECLDGEIEVPSDPVIGSAEAASPDIENVKETGPTEDANAEAASEGSENDCPEIQPVTIMYDPDEICEVTSVFQLKME